MHNIIFLLLSPSVEADWKRGLLCSLWNDIRLDCFAEREANWILTSRSSKCKLPFICWRSQKCGNNRVNPIRSSVNCLFHSSLHWASKLNSLDFGSSSNCFGFKFEILGFISASLTEKSFLGCPRRLLNLENNFIWDRFVVVAEPSLLWFQSSPYFSRMIFQWNYFSSDFKRRGRKASTKATRELKRNNKAIMKGSFWFKINGTKQLDWHGESFMLATIFYSPASRHEIACSVREMQRN